MAIISSRKNREIRDNGTVTFVVKGADVGKTIDFMGIADGFRIVNVNVTVDEAFANVDNTISVGIEGDLVRFIPATTANAIKGIGFNNRQLSATQSMAIVVDIIGTASATGSATVTVEYAKLPVSKQEY
ncbi:MAG: hypothetical protein RQ763_00095 [Sulfurimonas sp.]|uniref:hypothetical protein n=1 Tax=Sulfurimonas sp. TaxID=2022749 RepID=UPI0028CDC0A2|nr:hypothetical protein [Sulfurimonas sp.]MDT8337573.1 hypothetical protein [Sulfurimonas sp.]